MVPTPCERSTEGVVPFQAKVDPAPCVRTSTVNVVGTVLNAPPTETVVPTSSPKLPLEKVSVLSLVSRWNENWTSDTVKEQLVTTKVSRSCGRPNTASVTLTVPTELLKLARIVVVSGRIP